MQPLNGQVTNRFFANSSRKMTDMGEIFSVNRFNKADPFYFTETASTSAVSPSPTNYAGKTYTFTFPEGEIYDNPRLILNWGEFNDTGGTDTIRKTLPIARVTFEMGGVLFNDVNYDFYVTNFKILPDKEKRVLKSFGFFTDEKTGAQAEDVQRLPLITQDGGLLSRDIKATSTSIPVPYGVGSLFIRVVLKDQFVINGTTAAPTLDGIEVFCDKREFRDVSAKTRALAATIGPVPMFTHRVMNITPQTATTDGNGEIEALEFPLTNLSNHNTQFIVLRCYDQSDNEHISAIPFSWDSKLSGIYEKGVVAKILKTSAAVEMQMFNSGNSVNSDDRWEDGDLIISASVSPISEFETWNPDFYSNTSLPSLQLEKVQGLQPNHTYTFAVYAVVVESFSLKAGRDSEK